MLVRSLLPLKVDRAEKGCDEEVLAMLNLEPGGRFTRTLLLSCSLSVIDVALASGKVVVVLVVEAVEVVVSSRAKLKDEGEGG